MEEELKEAKAEIERLRIDCEEKLKKKEEENLHLLLSLDEVIERDREKQTQLDILTEEAERLKAHVSILEKKCAQVLETTPKSSPNSEKWEGQDMECCTAPQPGTVPEETDHLRHSLRVKELELKEMDSRIRELEVENQQLQEGQIPKAAVNPCQLTKVRSRLKALEQTHKECSDNLKAREVEWSCQAQDLKIKDQVIQELRDELEGCHSSLTELKLQNEELSLMSQLGGRPEVEASEVALSAQQDSDEFAQLMEQLTLKNIALAKAQTDLRKEHEEKLLIQRELDRCKEMLEESSDCQLELMEQAAEIERKLTDELQQVFDALERLESELTDKTNEGTELEYELQSWQSVTDRLKKQFDESVTMRRGLEQSLIAQAEVEEMLRREIQEKDRRISNLEQQILLFDQEIRILEEKEENNMVKTATVRQHLQPIHNHDDGNQDLPAKKTSKQSSQHQQRRSEHVESPQKNGVPPSTHDSGYIKNPENTDNLQETEDLSKQSSQQHVESSRETELSSQESKSEATSENEIPIPSKEQVEQNGNPQQKTGTNKQSSHQPSQESDEGASKQSSHQPSQDSDEGTSKQSSHQPSQESEGTSKQCSLRVETDQKVEENATKHVLKHKASPPQVEVANKQQSTHQDSQQAKVVSKHCPQRDGNGQKIKDSGKLESEQGGNSSSLQSSKVTNNQSSKHVNQQPEGSKQQCSQGTENVTKTEVASKQTPQQSKIATTKQIIFQANQQQTEAANKTNPPEKKRSPGKVLNMAQAFESGKTRVEVEGEICVTKENLKQQCCSRTNDDRSPFRDLNEDIFKKKATVAI